MREARLYRASLINNIGWPKLTSCAWRNACGTYRSDQRCPHGILARKEGVARRADFHLDDGILVTILPFFGFLALGAALSEEAPIRSQILEDDRAVIFGVDALFHLGELMGRKSTMDSPTLQRAHRVSRPNPNSANSSGHRT